MPSALPQIIRRIQDQDDAPTLGSGQNGFALVWNNATASFDAVDQQTQTEADARYLQLTGGTLSGDLYTSATVNIEATGNLNTNRVSARTAAGLTLSDDSNTLGIFIKDGGDVGIANSTPTVPLHVGFGGSTPFYTSTQILASSFGDASITVMNDFTDLEGVFAASATEFRFGTVTNHPFELRTNDTARLTVAADGNVTMANSLYLATDEVRARDSGGLHLRDDSGTSGIFIEDSTGHVGIGTTSPTSALHLASTGALNLLIEADTDNVNEADHANITLTQDGGAVVAHFGFFNDATNALEIINEFSDSIIFKTNNIQQARISNAGNLEMSSGNIFSTPDEDTASLFGRASIGYDGTNTDRAMFAHRDHATSTAAAFAQEADGDAIINVPTGQTIQFKSNGSDTVRINSAGRLGVGTTGVDALLHVEDGAAGAVTVASDTIALFEHDDDMAIQMIAPTNSVFAIRGHTPAGSVSDLDIEYQPQFGTLDFNLGSTYGLRIGQALFEPRVDNIVSLGSTSKRYTEVWAVDGTINTSDGNDKESIVNASLGLDFINRLQPKEWKWKESKFIVDGEVKFKAKKDRRKHTGLVAQDVKSVLDDLGIDAKNFAGYIVGEDGKLGLRYHEFMGPMIKAIQELSAKVEALEAA